MTSWEDFFASEIGRLRQFYLIEIVGDDAMEIERWLRDRFDLRSIDNPAEKLKTLSQIEMRQLRYDFIQFIKWLRRTRTAQANSKPQIAKTANTLDETRERDHSLE